MIHIQFILTSVKRFIQQDKNGNNSNLSESLTEEYSKKNPVCEGMKDTEKD